MCCYLTTSEVQRIYNKPKMASLSDSPSDCKDLHILLPSMDPKPNLLTPKPLSWQWNYHIPHYLSLDAPHPILYPHEDEVTFYLRQIDAGHSLPYNESLHELRSYYSVDSTQLSPNALLMNIFPLFFLNIFPSSI